MKRQTLKFGLLVSAALVFAGCGGGSGGSASTAPKDDVAGTAAVSQPVTVPESELVDTEQRSLFSYSLTSLYKGSAVSTRAAGDELMTGELLVTNVNDGTSETYAWSALVNPTTFAMTSNKTIVMAPGTYEFSLLLEKDGKQYVGVSVHTITDANQSDFPLTVSPVIGALLVDVEAVDLASGFQFQYDPAELVAFAQPKVGVRVDGGAEQLFEINPATGLSDAYINLDDGEHNIQLGFYDGNIQRGRSIEEQETVNVRNGEPVNMDLAALHGEMTLHGDTGTGDMNMTIRVPDVVVDEAGGLANLKAILAYSSGDDSGEQEINVYQSGTDYLADVNLNVGYGTFGFSLSFLDVSDVEEEMIGKCTVDGLELDATDKTVACTLEVASRSVFGGNLVATVGVNVFDENMNPVAGAKVYAGETFLGITGSGDFGTAGYLKTFLPTGDYTLSAQLPSSGSVQASLSALGLENFDIILNEGGVPNATVTPSQIDASLAQGTGEATYVTLKNTGDGALTWSAAVSESSAVSARRVKVAEVTEEMTVTAEPESVNTVKVTYSNSLGKAVAVRKVTAEEVESGRVIVKYKEGARSRSYHAGVRTMREVSSSGVELVEIQASDAGSYAVKLAELNSDPAVAYAEPDFRIKLEATVNDPSFSALWGLHNTGQTGGTVDADIDAPEAWDRTMGSANVVVGVIDTGVDYTHGDLAANMWTNSGEIPGNGVDDDGNGYVDDIHGYDFVNGDGDPMDDHYHGTHCAGTIGAEGNNGVGVIGVSPEVTIMALKFLDASGNGWTSDAVSAIYYAMANGATLTSNSWGGGGYSQALYDAIQAAGNEGQLFVAAAGNDGVNTDYSPSYPAAYTLDNIISVAATDHNDQHASFTNFGAVSVDLAAPGVSIYSTIPGNGYGTLSGTSMATPHVAGAAALLYAYNPSATAEEVRNAILSGVAPAGDDFITQYTATGGQLNVAGAMDAMIGSQWLKLLGTTSGTLASGESAAINVDLNASGMPLGNYSNTILITTNDGDSGVISVPVTLEVTQ